LLLTASALVDGSARAEDARSADAGQEASPPVDEPLLEFQAVATAHRLARPTRESSAQVTVLTREEIDANPTLTTDSLVRSVPSVATFRRSTSLVADPSSQGLNLRGVGPSGASRSLVLLDGVPVNDPFGGWVYWRALPRLGIDRVEVAPGGGSALYGSSALGGVLQMFSRPLSVSGADADVAYGSFRTALIAARAVQAWKAAGASLEGEWLRSDGYPVVASAQRGAIDTSAGSQHGNLNARVEGSPYKRLQLFASAGAFSERQNGGTRFTRAHVDLARVVLGARADGRRAGTWDLTVFGRLQEFTQHRARVSEERASEVLAARQRVPAQDEGGALLWRSPELSLFGTHVLLAGADARHVRGTSYEQLFPPMPDAQSALERDAGGRQLIVGAFVQDVYEASSWLQIDAALRFDTFRNDRGQQRVRRGDDDVERTRFDATQRQALSPRVGVLVKPVAWLAVRSAAYRAFRAPTLNELYRPFQVGTVLTAANPRLGPEFLTGAEIGVEALVLDQLTLRATGYWNVLDDPITNRTLAAPLPDGSQRQRENLGQARIRGTDLELAWRVAAKLSSVLAYTYVHSEVSEAPGARELLGKQLAHNPMHRANAMVAFRDDAWLSASVQVRVVGPHFEDDLNTRRIPAYAVVDAELSRQLFWRLAVFAAVENLLDTTYLVGRAGVDTVGAPFLARVGLRLRELTW
jgi:outer membrane receptor protein involved in Fe transport